MLPGVLLHFSKPLLPVDPAADQISRLHGGPPSCGTPRRPAPGHPALSPLPGIRCPHTALPLPGKSRSDPAQSRSRRPLCTPRRRGPAPQIPSGGCPHRTAFSSYLQYILAAPSISTSFLPHSSQLTSSPAPQSQAHRYSSPVSSLSAQEGRCSSFALPYLPLPGSLSHGRTG